MGLLSLFMVIAKQGRAQLSPFQSVYFQNQYLANPAMAGIEQGLNLNLGYQQQWANTPGSPSLQSFTGDYGLDKNVGLGLNVSNDQAGLIRQTKVMGTYAYHLPLTAQSRLSFGLSVGINDTYLDNNIVVGDASDLSLGRFNEHGLYVDGDFGIAYTSNGFNVQGAIPNLKSVFFKTNDEDDAVDRATFFTAASYKIPFVSAVSHFSLEPKVALRGVKGFNSILDAGANLNLDDYNLSLAGMYHSSKSVSFLLGFNLKNVKLLLAYTNETSQIRTYANNTFELGVNLKLFKNQ